MLWNRIHIRIRIQWGPWIRITILIRNPDPDPGEQNKEKKFDFDQKKRKKICCCVLLFSFWSSKTLIRIGSVSVSGSGFTWNAGSGFNKSGSTALLSPIGPVNHTVSVVTALPGSIRGCGRPGRGRWASWRARTVCLTRRRGTPSAAAAPQLPTQQKGIN